MGFIRTPFPKGTGGGGTFNRAGAMMSLFNLAGAMMSAALTAGGAVLSALLRVRTPIVGTGGAGRGG